MSDDDVLQAVRDELLRAMNRNVDHLVEIGDLKAWKAEAMAVLGEWEKVWEAAGRPGPLASSKADNVRRWIEEHR